MASDTEAPPSKSVFDIVDHTNASPWEKFVAELQKTLGFWGLVDAEGKSSKAPSSQQEPILRAPIAYENFNYTLLYQIRPPLPTLDPNFPVSAHPIHRWYGCSEFLVLSRDAKEEVLPDEARVLLSALICATGRSHRPLPLFVQVGSAWQQLFLGFSTASTVHTHYSGTHQPVAPPAYRHLSGLVGLFRSKAGENEQCYINTRSVFYTKFEGTEHTESSQPQVHPLAAFPPQLTPGGQLHGGTMGLQLAVIWPQFREDVFVDTAVYSDLTPMAAPTWHLTARPPNRPPYCVMADTVYNLLEWQTKQHPLLSYNTDSDTAGTSGRLGEDTFGKLTGGQTPRLRSGVEGLTSVMHAVGSLAMEYTGSKPLTHDECGMVLSRLLVDGPGDLIGQLAVYVAIINQRFAGLRSVAMLWADFVRLVRSAWHDCTPLPRMGVAPNSKEEAPQPDLNAPLLVQKLQMINCCIQSKRARDEALTQYRAQMGEKRISAPNSSSALSRTGSQEEEDEFYDAMEDNEPQTSGGVDTPQGVLRPHPTLKLLGRDMPLNIPITQAHKPVTMDMIESQQEALAQLGTNEEAAEARARMHSEGLLADMRAFKAANPGCELADFVRWHSPRDYVETEDGRGQLSARMSVEGSIWHQAWNMATAVPAALQKPLFDHTLEAERALRYLEAMTVADFFNAVFPHIVKAALHTLRNTDLSVIVAVSHSLDEFDTIITASENGSVPPQAVHAILAKAERLTMDCLTLMRRLSNNADLVSRLAAGGEVVIGPSDRQLVGALFETMTSVGGRTFVPAETREFIIRNRSTHDTEEEEGGPSTHLTHRLFALLNPREFRVCCAFQVDAAFG